MAAFKIGIENDGKDFIYSGEDFDRRRIPSESGEEGRKRIDGIIGEYDRRETGDKRFRDAREFLQKKLEEELHWLAAGERLTVTIDETGDTACMHWDRDGEAVWPQEVPVSDILSLGRTNSL